MPHIPACPGFRRYRNLGLLHLPGVSQLTLNDLLEPKNPLSRARRKRAVPKLSPIPPAQDISGDPSCLGILASVSTYSPRLPGGIPPVVTSGFRQRLQLRGSVGLSPTSPKHVGCSSQLIDLYIYNTRAVSSLSNVFLQKWGAGIFCRRCFQGERERVISGVPFSPLPNPFAYPRSSLYVDSTEQQFG